jgi:uncharacterized membrane protein YccC
MAIDDRTAPQPSGSDVDQPRQVAEALREVAERVRLSAEERRAAAERARVAAEEDRTQAEAARKTAIAAVNETAEELAAILDRMKAVEKLRRTRRSRPNTSDPM